MKLSWALMVVGVLVVLTAQSHANVVESYTLDTSDGTCHVQGYGQIPVGDTKYDDANCKKYVCKPGSITIYSCSAPPPPPPECVNQRYPGHYPACCRTSLVCALNQGQSRN